MLVGLISAGLISAGIGATGLYAQAKPSQPASPAAGRMLLQLQERDWILRADALQYLSKHKVLAAQKPIIAILGESKTSPWLQGRAMVALARIGSPSAQAHILRLAKSKDPQLRGAAAEAIESLSGKSADQVLTALLKDEATDVRYRALASYARRNGAKAWAVVDPMTEPLDPSVCRWGSRALAFVGTKDALARLRKLAERRELHTNMVRGIQGITNPKLIELWLKILASLDPRSTQFAEGLSALQHFEEADLLAALMSNLATEGADTIRAVAWIATVMLPNPELGEPLRKAVARVDDTNTIKAVLTALGPTPMKPDQHKDLFEKYLEHTDANIRELAIRGLAHCKSVNLYKKLDPSVADKSDRVVQAALSALRRAPAEHAPAGGLVGYLKTPLKSDHGGIRTKAYDLLAHAGTAEDFKPAIALVGDRLRSTDEGTRVAAAEAFGGFAPDDQIEFVARAQGYVAHWMIIGTFLNDKDNTGFASVYPPEEKVDFEKKYIAKYIWTLEGGGGKKGELQREIGWLKASVDQTNGQLVIPPLVPPPASMAVAYAVSDFRMDAAREALLDVDGDDAYRIWLNGKQIAEQVAVRQGNKPAMAEQKGIKVTLKAGPNRLMVKTANFQKDWWVRLRFTDSKGVPVEIAR